MSPGTAPPLASRTALALLGGFDDGCITLGAFRMSGASAVGDLGGGLGGGFGGGNSGIMLDRNGNDDGGDVSGGVITGGFGVLDEELDCPAGNLAFLAA